MLRILVFLAMALGGGLASVAAQSNDKLDELLSQPQARVDSTSYLVLTAAGLVPEDADLATAFQTAIDQKLLPKNRLEGDPVSIEDLSFLVMKALKVPGGLEWTFLPNPRAAYRELAYYELINASAGPARLVAGDEVVRTLNAVIAREGGRK